MVTKKVSKLKRIFPPLFCCSWIRDLGSEVRDGKQKSGSGETSWIHNTGRNLTESPPPLMWQLSISEPVLRIDDILGWIRIRGSMPLINVSGFGYGSGSSIRILLFSSLTFKMPTKDKFFNTIFAALSLFEAKFKSFFKEKKSKSQNSRNQGFSYYFCTMIEGSGSGSRAGSGSGSSD